MVVFPLADVGVVVKRLEDAGSVFLVRPTQLTLVGSVQLVDAVFCAVVEQTLRGDFVS